MSEQSKNEWREIESAPKDGTRILAVCGPHVCLLAWGGKRPPGWKMGGDYGQSFWGTPTHWMPLPDPPTS